jgi:hypothetical protein
LDAGIVGSNPTRGMGVYVYVYVYSIHLVVDLRPTSVLADRS